MNLKVYKFNKEARLPTKSHTDDAAFDLYSLETKIINKGSTALIKTGIGIYVPKGYVGLLRERSSVAKLGLKLAGGVIDSEYSGEIGVMLINVSNDSFPNVESNRRGYLIEAGDRIAQIMLIPIANIYGVEEVGTIWESNRGAKGFGSSGR